MTGSRTTGQGGTDHDSTGDDGAENDVIAPVTYLPGVREAAAEREALAVLEVEKTRAADARRAENITMHALTRRGQSRAEVADLLRRREIDSVTAETELTRLESVGLIDDRALALDLVDRLRSRKKLGPSALRNELMQRKLDRAAIDEALAESAHDDDDDLLLDLARDRARRLGGLDRTTAERRLVDFLARKGHTGSAARDAARQALDGDDSSFDDADEPGHRATVHRVQFR
ncbi:regulatory protein RecX [Microcella sp.]|uniref:regulatory protein RecX n=1 Tax=Microcella sp. TaxID=1913979 RepID=UPI0025655253|nr:regulatory protein RecX [Microcella sp.]MBX9470556.1 recombination regulator RecX [Microcella sp.]